MFREYYWLIPVILFMVIFNSTYVVADGVAYYVILKSLVHYQSLDLEHIQYFNQFVPYVKLNPITDRYTTFVPFGVALFSLPFYLLSDFVNNFFHYKDTFYISLQGDTLIHTASITLASNFYTVLMLIMLYHILIEKYSKKASIFVILATYFGTSIIAYSSWIGYYSHSFSAFTATLVLYAWTKINTERRFPLTGFLIGVSGMVRYSNSLLLLPFLFLTCNKRSYRNFIYILSGFLISFSLVLIYNHIQYGNIFETAYQANYRSTQYEIKEILPVYTWDVLFSLKRGIIWWSPIVIFSIIGLTASMIKNGVRKVDGLVATSAIAIVIFVLAIGSFPVWWGAWSFGQRYSTILFPFFVIGLVKFLELKKFEKKYLILVSLTSLYTVFLFLNFVAFGQGNETLPVHLQHTSDSGIDHFLINWLRGDYNIGLLLKGLIVETNLHFVIK